MAEVGRLLAGTVELRPYVFLFLLAYLALAVPTWGWRRTAINTILGYLIAWLAEYSSIHNGVPFGLYSYISGPTIDRELWIAGVPFMDSISFVFLTFAGLATARSIVGPLANHSAWPWAIRLADPAGRPHWPVWLLAALLTMGADIIIDPVALQGERWFLGRIYAYAGGGPYFGVPLANFAGWFLVSATILGIFLLLDRWLLARWFGPWHGYPGDAAGGVALFTGVLAFNLFVALAIGEVGMAFAGLAWAVLMLAPVLRRVARFARESIGSLAPSP
jgi:uncharacterized membrane protein